MVHYSFGKKIVFLLSFLFVATLTSYAVPVHINSGNPRYPFPRFLQYAGSKLDNLGTQNAEGVVHLEMERDIRIAYQVAANLIGEEGTVYKGVKYLKYAYLDPLGPPYDCTEFDGYAMLCAAYMADKVTFDGLWLRTHDYRMAKVKRYHDGSVNNPNYDYGKYVLCDTPLEAPESSGGKSGAAAPDGDYDVALALYIAYKQWGDNMGIDDSEGNPISYKQGLIEVLTGIAGKGYEDNGKDVANDCSLYCGSIGFDGYCKSNNHDGETSPWAYSPNEFVPSNCKPVSSQRFLFVDYIAPAYFHEFADLIDSLHKESDPILDDKDPEWLIQQYRRAEASSDWIMGQIPEQSEKMIAFAGHLLIDENNKLSFTNEKPAEDFRLSFRTLLNYVWHGEPTYSWDPVSHKVVEGSNDYLMNCSKRMAKFMNSPQGSPWNNPCKEFGGGPSVTYKGPSTNTWKYTTEGVDEGTTFTLNWMPSVGTNCAIVTQDMNLLAQLYRQCAIDWDTDGDFSRVEDVAVPKYFHGMYKLYGMLISSGNFLAPSSMQERVNMKVYKSIKDSMTLAYEGDLVEYYLDYRNMGSEMAKDVVIVEHVAPEFEFVSASDQGVYDASTHTITWKIGNVEGVKSDDVVGSKMNLTGEFIKKTMGQVSYVAKVSVGATGRKCSSATITCSNGTGWVSNEYPNHCTATMQRNCVDVINRSLVMEKTADCEMVNPGNLVTYTISFENSSKEGWLDGGRPRVNVAMANNGINGQQEKFGVRLYNDAIEPYINYKNYRISYYMYDPGMTKIKGPNDSYGWDYKTQICEFLNNGGVDGEVDVSLQKIVNGEGENGTKYNQRIIVRFPESLVTTTSHISNYNGKLDRVHKGSTVPLRLLYSIAPTPQVDVDYTDDWSFDPDAKDAEDGNYYPITPSYQEIDPVTGKSIEKEVDEYLPCICEKPSHTIKNVLVEEFDGYVWRRILGTGPTAGREYEDVEINDTLPKGMEFVAFKGKCPLEAFDATWENFQIADGRWVVKWKIPYLQRNQKGTIVYCAKASFSSGEECPHDDELMLNVAWMSAKNESAFSDTAAVTVSCSKVPDPIVRTTMTKTADKESYEKGDPITYEIEYEQTHGFVTENAAAKSTDWTLSGGASVSDGKVTVNGGGGKAKYNYSYASYIYVEMDCDGGYNGMTLYFRDRIKLEIKPDWAGPTFSCTDGSTRKPTKSFPYGTPAHLKIELNGDVLRLWLDDQDTTEIAAVSFVGLSADPGFFGVESGTFNNIYVHTDHAYDLTIVDRKPAEVSFVSADNDGKLITGADRDSIVWVFEQGIDNPIPYGKKYKVSWAGVVDDCTEGIYNTAYTHLLGHKSNEIWDYVMSGCGEDEKCPLEGVEFLLEKDTICSGASIKMQVLPKGNFKYCYMAVFGEREVLRDTVETNTYEYTPTSAGDYKFKVEIVSKKIQCTTPSDVVELNVVASPVGAHTEIEIPFCPGAIDQELSVLKKNIALYEREKYTIDWFDADGESIAQPEFSELKEVGKYQYSYLLTTKEGCKAKEKANVSFELEQIADPVVKTPITYLLKDTTANGTFANLLMHDADVVDSPKDLVWYDENMQIVQGTPIPPVPANGTDTICTYYVKRQNNRGCESDLVELKVIVSGMAVPLVHDIIYCLNEEATPLWVEPGTVENSDKEWEVVYYSADGIELTVDELRTPKTNVAGTTTYYVAQREVGNPSNISSKVPLTVTVVGVPLPDVSMNQTEYCKGEQYKELLVQSKFDQLSNTTSYFRWSIDGRSVEGTPVAETQVETIIYGVVDSVRIDNDHCCLSDTAKLEVTTMFIPAPAGTHNVTYLKEEADEDGFYKPLLEKNPQAVTLKDMNAGYSFVWYDSLMQLIDVSDLRPDEYGSPSPQKESSWDDQKVVGMKYHVRQKLGRCLSDTVHVDVLISDDLMPDVYPMNYCHHADAEPLTASINSGDESSTGYELLWYSPADDYTTPSTEAPTPSTEEVGMTIYKVSQIKDGKESPTVPLRVTIFPNPELIVKELPQTCGEEIHIKQYVELNNTIDTSNVSFHSYNDPNCQNQMDDKDTVFTKSGTFYAKAYYTIFSEPNIVGVCSSTIEKIDVSIDDLSDFVATAPNSVCPNGEIELSATAKSTTREDIQFVWSGDAEGEGETLTTQDETGEFGKTYTYKVEASAGACLYDTTLTVKVGQGELTGVMKVNDKETKNFATCGGESITLSTTHEGSDYKWSDLEGNALGTGKSLTVTPDEAKASLSYIVSLVNKCETSDTIVVDVHPLRLTADFSKLDVPICEKSEASASLTLQGYDPDMENAYIKWFHGTEELTAWAGQTTLSLSSVTTDDSGDYTYEVSNGICLAKTDDAKLKATLKVKPYVKFEEPTTFEAPYGDPAELSISGVVPSSASAAWKGTSHEGEGLPFSVTSVTADELFKVTLSADNYCDVEANVQLLVDAKVAVKITAEKDMICLDDQAVLTADTSDTKGKVLHPESYQIEWYAVDAESGAEQKLNGSGFSLNDTPASSLSYYSKVIYGTQEVKSEAVAVEVVAPVQYTLPENLVSCSGENVDIEVTVTAGDDPKIVWTEDQSTEFTLTVAPEQSHTYEFTLTNKDMCPVVGSAFVDVKDAPIITMDDSRKVCEGADVVVSPKVEGEDVVAYEWRDAEDELIFRELKLEFTPEESGYIYFIAKSGSCGSSKDSIYVEVVELPVVTVDSLSFTQREIQVENNNGGAYMYRVDKLDWQEDNLYVGLGYGMMHTAYVKDEFGCIGLTPFFVVKPPVQINEFFTPDEDGVHDVWEVTTIMEAYPNSTVKIYDRWGKVVGTLDSSNQEWDGTYNGRPLPSTDYWYLITVPEIRRQFKGHFTLIRN